MRQPEQLHATDHDACGKVELHLEDGTVVPLRQRSAPARVIDFIQFCSAHELPELQLRLAEMGQLVDEIHIAEADRTWIGKPKEFVLPDLLQNDSTLAKWKSKIVHHRVRIPTSARGYDVQHATIAMKDKIPAAAGDVLLEGDLDEIVSRPVLRALRNCLPQGFAAWDAQIEMENYKYNMGWTTGHWKWPPVAHDFKIHLPTLVQEDDSVADKRGLRARHAGSDISSYVIRRPHGIHVKGGLPAGWHFSMMLDGPSGIAYKILDTGITGPPWWASGKSKPALEQFLKDTFLPYPRKYDSSVHRSDLKAKDIPEAMVEAPSEFKLLMGDVHV